MITHETNEVNSPVRKIKGKAERYQRSASGDLVLQDTYAYTDKLKGFTIERLGEGGKFFGFGVSQKANIKIMDVDRTINITTDDYFRLNLRANEDPYINTFPTFKVSETHRDELTNELSITAYDDLRLLLDHQVGELPLTMEGNTTVLNYLQSMCALMGKSYVLINLAPTDLCLADPMEKAPSYNGEETLKELADDIAEVTQTIYYINTSDQIVFKRLNKDSTAVINIDKETYFDLDCKTNRRLTAVCKSTELGDDVIAKLDISGTTQYVRDNAFWEDRSNIADLVDDALANVGGMTIAQFNLSWRGNYFVEVGDKINFTTKDNKTATSYLLNDQIEYDGYLKESTKWEYEDDTGNSSANPTSLGDKLNQTSAIVDKVNNKINLTAQQTEINKSSIAALEINTEQIRQTVESVETTTEEGLNNLDGKINTLSNKVETKMDAEGVDISIQQALANGVDKVITKEQRYSFDDTGLTISNSGSKITTTITEDGMRVNRDGELVLTANNEGVEAEDLHATTYLIIGDTTRFESYNSKTNERRTGIFWIGGSI